MFYYFDCVYLTVYLFSECILKPNAPQTLAHASLSQLQSQYKTETLAQTIAAAIKDPNGEDHFLKAFCEPNRGGHETRLSKILASFDRNDLHR